MDFYTDSRGVDWSAKPIMFSLLLRSTRNELLGSTTVGSDNSKSKAIAKNAIDRWAAAHP
jgi:hypothetical protein